ncbi:MAG: tetratricopeptide repeat protein, partial [Anaerolineales bacterium]|nr:tetratricopeptide repeat protein [Anaerolineales bacterium]
LLRSAYHFFIGNYQEALEHAQKAEETLSAVLTTELALYTQVVRVISLLHLGRLDDAMAHALKTLELDRKVGNRREEGRILNAMGWVALEQNRPVVARQYFTDALKIAHEVRDPGLESRVLNHLAKLEGEVNGNYAFAREYFEKSYQLAHDIGDRYMEVGALSNVGFAAGMQGDFDAARSYHEQALSLAREIGDKLQEVYTLVNLSAVSGLLNQAATALQQTQRAVEVAQKISERSGEAWAMLYMGHAYLLEDEVQLAQSAYARSLAIREELKQASLSMEAIAGLVETHLRTGDIDSASRQAEKILQFLDGGSTFDGTDEPLRVYYTCYRFLEETKDPRSSRILQSAKDLLNIQVSRFSDEAGRKRYVENIPWRRAIRDA